MASNERSSRYHSCTSSATASPTSHNPERLPGSGKRPDSPHLTQGRSLAGVVLAAVIPTQRHWNGRETSKRTGFAVKTEA